MLIAGEPCVSSIHRSGYECKPRTASTTCLPPLVVKKSILSLKRRESRFVRSKRGRDDDPYKFESCKIGEGRAAKSTLSVRQVRVVE